MSSDTRSEETSSRTSSSLSSWSRHMQTADPTMSGYRHRNIFHGPGRDLEPHVLEEVKREAKAAWDADLRDWTKTPNIRPTTYTHSFYQKAQEDPAKMRPTSPHRRNNPHPPLVFLSCRLRTVPGFHDANAAVNKDAYRIDAKCDVSTQKQRQMLRQKYIGRPATVSVSSYKQKQAMRTLMSPHSAQAADAWMKVASKQDQEAVMEMVHNTNEKRFAEDAVKQHVRPQFQPSLRRYLKGAGVEEARAIAKLFHTIDSRTRPQPPNEGPHYHITDYSKMKKEDFTSMRKVARPRPFQRDFVLHPEFLERSPSASQSAKVTA